MMFSKICILMTDMVMEIEGAILKFFPLLFSSI